MISHLIGPKKWISLAAELKIYLKDFDIKIAELQRERQNVADIIAICLTEWRMQTGKSADVRDVITALDNIKLHWVAGKQLFRKF